MACSGIPKYTITDHMHWMSCLPHFQTLQNTCILFPALQLKIAHSKIKIPLFNHSFPHPELLMYPLHIYAAMEMVDKK